MTKFPLEIHLPHPDVFKMVQKMYTKIINWLLEVNHFHQSAPQVVSLFLLVDMDSVLCNVYKISALIIQNTCTVFNDLGMFFGFILDV